jgi:hypothetical protein
MSCPDPAVYILTGILPIEAPIHIKALTFFNNVCHQDEQNTEKKLARRQLIVKEKSSNSWCSTFSSAAPHSRHVGSVSFL